VGVVGVREVPVAHDSTAVITAVILLQHGLSDDAVLRYIARRPVNERDSADALATAHHLLYRSNLDPSARLADGPLRAERAPE